MRHFEFHSLRDRFPILSREVHGKPLAYLDNGATAQKPREVIDAMSRFLAEGNANIHRGVHTLSQEATDAYENARAGIARSLGMPDSHVLIFVRGATEAINLVAHGLTDRLVEGDEVVLTLMEHHANFVPWQVLAEKTGATLRFIAPRDNGELDLEEWRGAFGERTRVAAFTHVSNVLGTVNPVADMTAFARERGVVTLVDGAQALPHGPVDLGAIGGDFYTFSGHKVFGPDGIGVLAGRRELLDAFPPYQTGGDMIETVSVDGTTYRTGPERFEAGTPNISGVIGLAEAFRLLDELDWAAARTHEKELCSHLTSELTRHGDARVIGTAPDKEAVVSFVMDAAHAHDIGTILDTEGVAIRTGHHCAQPLLAHYGLAATARASMAFYNTHEDVEAFLRGIAKVKRFFT